MGGGWIQTHKAAFLATAAVFIGLSFYVALREKRKTGSNRAFYVFAGTLVLTAVLLGYNRIKYGYFL